MSGFGVCVDDESAMIFDHEAAIILRPILGRGGGPLLEAATVCDGGHDGSLPAPPLPHILSRRSPPPGGDPEG